ncbi:MAG: tryptophan--tRNA ligase [Candidatus Kerfeldbacteria bacterium RIFOXYA2_FULL_38_24]|uniref:Tryptophan--tRNA ligase n=1 Tax=Candidatus Kerfeldbacteria bacterium RIFOXYB2_FULL_38_14 TaxID=1798547 RepID=A0A1G2BEH7_9BACT|nr:MAG: tryptophan--tRNA ligase [Candidatus Kerfeldbacteria bacterium RIFOXYB2_FULL_38_14]OGY87826.1 MAG: tryptophan--tRNA ligase [Candidatus Kerfeldbacteria bacterium RIFOXYA2_FULL_38_24]OGY90544.1 MAG: tryptophan--tRNA ligase [Candidatus Kerfeldbacteria bacterium RIFOXYC2_FULL_38_9]
MKKIILTGDRPTGQLHIGHFCGALKNRVALQDQYDTYVMIADVQALTDNFNDPQKVRKNVYEVAMDNLAVGIDPKKSTIFIQSLIPEIAELTVFYSNLVTIARLKRNPTVKEEINQKKDLFKDDVTFGFLGYPVSQAADITAFQADLVPVGEDQLPMIEQTREIVRKFNKIYGETLKEPEAKIGDFPRVLGMDGRKMSKSLGNAITFTDTADEIRNKIKGALTNDLGAKNLLGLLEQFSDDLAVIKKFKQQFKSGTIKYSELKPLLADIIIQKLKPIREKRVYYEKNRKVVETILLAGTKKARLVAQQTLAKVKEKMFLNYFKDAIN